jgi:hypothetical protein
MAELSSCFKRRMVSSRNSVTFRARSAMFSPLGGDAAECGNRHFTFPLRILHLRAKAANRSIDNISNWA